MAKLYFLFAILLHGALLLVVHVHGQDQQGFISVDCGASEDHTDNITGIKYTTDDNYIDSGVSKTILREFNTRFLDKKYSNVRSFPEETRNCYTLRPTAGKNHSYLIRASFMYGNYDDKSQFPEFDLYLGVNKWNTVKLMDASNITTFEIIHVPQSDYIHVCLVNTGSGVPFISVLELRQLNNNSYITQTGSLELFARSDCGLSPNEIVRYQDDTLDRIWSPLNFEAWDVINTSSSVVPNNFLPPPTVMSTAITPNNVDNTGVGISWRSEGNVSKDFYLYLHFAEIVEFDELQDNQTREVNIFINNELWYGPFSPNYLRAITIYSITPATGSYFEIWINRTTNSTLLPILNAIEIYTVKQLPNPQTDQNDVDAIMNIKSFYGLKLKNWQGDPCAPDIYVWNGLNCSYDGFSPPRIVSLNLSSSGLTAKIAPYISNLTMIQTLDLSNNNLTGTVPDYLSQLPFLKTLNLQGNNLSGTLPVGLYEKSKNQSILLSVEENPNLCLTDPCQEKKQKKKNNDDFVVPVVASVGGFMGLLLAALAIYWGLKRKKQAAGGTTATKVNAEFSNKKDEELEMVKKQQFTYSEILSITNNFDRVVGKGGFGTVYYGHLNENEVAIKMLSHSSAQGFKEFHAEAKLLTRVHHRNLTTLVGYCMEGPNMGLIYEYMSNGDLAWHLSDRNPHTLNWEERLKVAIDAAQGLEYLHNGCKPPMIHRDVKSTNILLNEKLQAKLADFGLSRAFPAEGDSHAFTAVVGTPGYLDPEYYVSNRLTEKSDVFSFGVVLLEIITGRQAIGKNSDQNGHVVEWVNSILSKGDIQNVADPRLQQEYDKNSVWKLLELAMACTSINLTKRPTMSQVVTEIKQCLAMEMDKSFNNDVSEIIELPEIIMNTEQEGPKSR